MSKKSNKEYTYLQKFSLYFFKHAKTSIFLWLVVAMFGALCYGVFLKREGFPSINLPLSTISANYFVDDKAKVDSDIAKPVSDAVKKVPGVKKVTATSADNFASFFIEYEEGSDPIKGSQKAAEVVAKLQLPESATLSYQTINATKYGAKYDLLVSVYGSGDVASQLLSGQAAKVAEKLRGTTGVTLAEVVEQTKTGQNPITGETVTTTVAFDQTAVTQNGALEFGPSLTIGLVKSDAIDTLDLYHNVVETISFTKNDPVKAVESASFAESIEEQISSLQTNLLEGLMIVILISFLLISWRVGLATALSMATILLMTIAALKLFGYSLNTITLFALILSLGLIVDDTTIVAEAIDAGKGKGKDKSGIVAHAIKRVARASTAGTFVTMLAFAPMMFIGGVLGSFIRALPITIITSLALSLLISLTLIPFLSRKLILGNSDKSKHESKNPFIWIEHRLSSLITRVIRHTKNGTKQRLLASVMAVVISISSLVGAGAFMGKLKFDIFPAGKDSNEMTVSLQFKQGTTIADAEAITGKANAIVAKTIGTHVERAVYLNSGTDQSATMYITLVSLKERSTTAPQMQAQLKEALAVLPDVQSKIAVSGAGGQPADYPFSIEIKSEDVAKSTKLASDMLAYISSTNFKRPNGQVAQFTGARLGSLDAVSRVDGNQIVKVESGFDGDDVSAMVIAAQKHVEEKFTESVLTTYGFNKSDIYFNFGNESNNQDSFKSMLIAFPILLVMMYVLLALFFKSLLQPFLIFLAIPFSFLGVAAGLFYTNNPLSFFVMIGFFALIGIAVNNTIMLVDFANQELKAGKGHSEAMASAVTHRLRPLLTTSITSIVALTPLALSDPFWESLAITLMGGLFSSTILVITVFPYFWLIAEWFRLKSRKLWHKIRS